MFLQLLYFVPCVVALLWFFSFLMKLKTQRQTFFMILQGLAVFYYATLMVYLYPGTSYKMMVVMDAANVPIRLIMLAITVLYLRMHHTRTKFHYTQLLLLTPAIVVGAIVNLLYYIVGFDDAAKIVEMSDLGMDLAPYADKVHRIFIFFTTYFVSFCTLVFILNIVLQCYFILRRDGFLWRKIYNFFFQGSKSNTARTIAVLALVQVFLMLPIVLIGRKYLMFHPVFAVSIVLLVSAVKYCIAHIEYNSGRNREFSLYEITHTILTGKYVEPTNDKFSEVNVSAQTAKFNALAEKLRFMFENEHLYRNEELTLDTLSERMGIGRTTLSLMVNQHYGKPFREVVNHYRIEAAKLYMKEHPSATQEIIAMECGFKNASSLNKKFKELEGDTPMIWLAKFAAKDNK